MQTGKSSPEENAAAAGQPTSSKAKKGGGAVSLATVMSRFSHTVGLSPEGETYMNTVKERLEKLDCLKFKFTTFNRPVTGIIFQNEKFATVMVFHETLSDSHNDWSQQVMQYVLKNYLEPNNLKQLNFIIVTKADYGERLADKMVRHIINTHLVANGVADDFTAMSLAVGENGQKQALFYDTNRTKYREFIARNSPHGVPARDDCGILLTVDDESSSFSYNVNRSEDRLLSSQDIMAVTGYTEIIMDQRPVMQTNQFMMGGFNQPSIVFRPIVHITELVTSGITSPRLCFLAISAFVQAMVGQLGWRDPLRKVSGGADSKFTNVGMLITRDDNTVSNYKTLQEIEQLLNFYFVDPMVSVDIELGRASIPGLTDLIWNQENFLKHAVQFSGIQVKNTMLVAKRLLTYTGQVQLDNIQGIADTRYCDYLYFCRHVKPETITDFLMVPENPNSRVMRISEHIPDARFIYMNQQCILTHDAVVTMNEMLGKCGLSLLPRNRQVSGYNFNAIAPNAALSNIGDIFSQPTGFGGGYGGSIGINPYGSF